MLVPAISKKTEIEEKFKSLFYSDDMMYEVGGIYNYVPNIYNDTTNCFQYAIVNARQELIGYFSFEIDWYSSCAQNFGLIAFEKGNPMVGFDVFKEFKRLIEKYHLHRVEWRMVGGNPIERHYDKICKKYNGTKHILRDAIKDMYGTYRDSVIYELIL